MAYDPVGNRLTSTANDGYQSATVNFSYAAGGNRLATLLQGGTAIRQFGYTASGNVASDLRLQAGAWVGNDLQYNQGDRLATVVTEPSSGKVSQSTSYAYDAVGQRLLKQGPQGLRFYQYDPAGHLLEEGILSNGSAVPERDYIYLGGRPVALLLPGTGALFFLHGDRLDTPQFATDGAERAEWKAAYQPFGAIRPVILNLAQNLRLPGQYADLETGYYHNGFRDYDPSLGRYLQSDPIGLKGGLNPYVYAYNNPVAFKDPSGLQTTEPKGEHPPNALGILHGHPEETFEFEGKLFGLAGAAEFPEPGTVKGITEYLQGKIADSGQEILESIAKLFGQSKPEEEWCPVYRPSSGPYHPPPPATPGAPQPGQPR
jgi:RHS repeat-associated protein